MQDPYVKMCIGKEVKQIEPHAGGGKTPTWNKVLEFQVLNNLMAEITVMDNDKGSDDFVGDCIYSLRPAIMRHTKQEEKIQINFENKSIGYVFAAIEFAPDTVAIEQEKV